MLSTVEKWVDIAEQLDNESRKKLVFSYMEYVFRFLLIGYKKISREKKQTYINSVKKIDHIVGTRQDKASKIIARLYHVLGVKNSGKILEIYLGIRSY